MENKVTLRRAFVDKYQRMEGLDYVQQEELLKLQGNVKRKGLLHRCRLFLFGLFVISIVGVVWHEQRSYDHYEIAFEVLGLHHSRLNPEIWTSDVDRLQKYFGEKYFGGSDAKLLRNLEESGFQIIGARRCKVAGQDSVHVYVKNLSTDIFESVHYTPLTTDYGLDALLGKNKKIHVEKFGDLKIKIFVVDGNLLISATERAI